MSIRCKVCNTTRSNLDQAKSDITWTCQTCGNMLDVDGRIVTSE